jgi:hypothetical protein
VCFTLIRSTLSIPLPHPFTSHPPFFSSVQYTCLRPLPSHLMVRILLTFYHSLFPFPLFLSSAEYSTVTNVFCIWVCIWSCLFLLHVYLWLYLPHMKENMQPLSFWAWLTSFNMISSNCNHLPSNHIITPYDWVILHYVYTTIYWSTHQLYGTWLFWIVL